MSTIAWDGTTLAADQAMSHSDGTIERMPRPKIHKINGKLCGVVGELAAGLQLLDWVANGMHPREYPDVQRVPEYSATLIVIERVGTLTMIREYDRDPVAIEVRGPFHAAGSGRKIALGALHAGADAARAVEIAARFDDGSRLYSLPDTLTFDDADERS